MNTWFKHDTFTTSDPKIVVLLHEFGASGYAFFWRLLEMLYASEEGDLTLDNTTLMSLSIQLKTPTETLKQILARCFDLEIFTKTVSYNPTNRDKNTFKLDENFGSKTPKMIQNDPDLIQKNDPDFLDQMIQNNSMHLSSRRVKEKIVEQAEKRKSYKEKQSMHGKKGGRPIGSIDLDQKGYESQDKIRKDNNKDLRSKQLKTNIKDLRSKTHWSNFLIFWKFYPKRVAKTAAYKIWTTKKLDDKLELILTDLKKRKDDDSWQRGYIPNPSNYLNNERWTDEIQKPPREKKNLAAELFDKNFQIAFGKRPEFANGEVILEN